MTFQMALRYYAKCKHGDYEKEKKGAYVSLDVEVLEVEGVLPDVDADDGDVGEEGVLVGRRRDLEALGRGVQALRGSSADVRRGGRGGTHVLCAQRSLSPPRRA